jgi:hypothetical protein
VINKMVLIYAVSLPLSAGTVTQVTADLGLAAAIGVAMLGAYLLTFLNVPSHTRPHQASKYVLRRHAQTHQAPPSHPMVSTDTKQECRSLRRCTAK